MLRFAAVVFEMLRFEMFRIAGSGFEMFRFEMLRFEMFRFEMFRIAGSAFEMFRFEMLRFEMLARGFEMFRKGFGFDGFQTWKLGV